MSEVFKSHDHRKSFWAIAGGAWLWCYRCGALRQANALGARWVKPTGPKGRNPAPATEKPVAAVLQPPVPTSCGYCHYDEAEGELLEQCAACKAIDAEKANKSA